MKYQVEYIKKEYKEIEAENAFDAIAEARDKASHGYEVRDFWPLKGGFNESKVDDHVNTQR